MAAHAPRVVAILNSNEDLVNLVRDALHDEGYLTIAHHISDLRDGATDIGPFLSDRDPRVVIYDVAPPFALNWKFLQVLKAHPAMNGRRILLTTNNSTALREICGVDAMQIVGTDDDLGALLAEVGRQFEAVAG